MVEDHHRTAQDVIAGSWLVVIGFSVLALGYAIGRWHERARWNKATRRAASNPAGWRALRYVLSGERPPEWPDSWAWPPKKDKSNGLR